MMLSTLRLPLRKAQRFEKPLLHLPPRLQLLKQRPQRQQGGWAA